MTKLTGLNHLGIILDGNRRWAKKRGLTNLEGHKEGYENLKVIGKEAINQGVKYISAFVFSTENWNRSKSEIEYLMRLLIWVSKHEIDELNKENIRLQVAGSRANLSSSVIKALEKIEAKTKNNTKGTLILYLNYGGQQEIVDAIKSTIEQNISSDKITPDTISEHLYLPEIPPVDMIIRTSGEHRLSNFLLWHSAYSELYFSDKFWPEFTTKDLNLAIDEFRNRQRRFGS